MSRSAYYATPEGLEILSSEESAEEVAIIIKELGSGDESMQGAALHLLTAFAASSPTGHSRVFHILTRFQAELGKRYLLQGLLSLWNGASKVRTGLHLLRLLNALMVSEGHIEDKQQLRNQISGLKFAEVLDDKSFSDDTISSESMVELRQEVRSFRKTKGSDNSVGQRSPEGVDINNPTDIFQAILSQVADSPNEPIFLNILRNLLLLDPSDGLSDAIWVAIEKLVDRARLVESKEEADKLVRLQTSAAYMSKARNGDNCILHNLSCGTGPSTLGLQTSPPEPPPLPPVPPAPPLPPLTPQASMEPPEAPPAPGTFADLLNKKSKGLQSSSKRKIPDKSTTLPSSPKSGKFLNDSTDGQITPSFASPSLPAPRSKLKGFAWNKVPASTVVAASRRGQGNLWTRAADHLKKGLHLDFGKLEELFTQESPTTPGTGEKKAFNSSKMTPSSLAEDRFRKRDEVTLLSHKRNFSVNIFLKQFKEGIDNLMEWIEECRGENIGLEKLKALTKILPEREEAETLRKYDGDPDALGVAAKFLRRLIQIENYDIRIESMLLKEEFASTIDYVRDSLRIALHAGQDLKGCKELQEFMSIVLMAGNFMNAGSYSGNAVGFKMTSLWKLSEIKSTINAKMTLLHFVVQEAETKHPALLQIPNLLKLSAEADKVSVDAINTDVRSLRGKMKKVVREIESVPEIKHSLGKFLEIASVELSSVEKSVVEVEQMRLELAEFLCEDPQGFKLEECFKAVEENSERKLEEKRHEERKRLQDETKQKRTSIVGDGKSSLREKYGLLPGETSDLTLKLDRVGSRIQAEAIAKNGSELPSPVSTLPQRFQKNDKSGEELMEFLEKGSNENRDIDQTSMNNNPWFHSIRRQQNHSKSKPRRMPLQGLDAGEGRERKVGWRERVAYMLEEEERLDHTQGINGQSDHGSVPSTLSNSQMASSGNIDKPREYCNPIFARQKIVRTGSAKLSSISDLTVVSEPSGTQSSIGPRESGLRLAGDKSPVDEQQSGSSNDLSQTGHVRRERWRKTRSLYEAPGSIPLGGKPNTAPPIPSPTTGPADLDQLLNQMESEKQRSEIQLRGKMYRWRPSDTSASHPSPRSVSLNRNGNGFAAAGGSQPCTDQPIQEDPMSSSEEVVVTGVHTDIDEVVRHCEKTKEEIDNMGLVIDTSVTHVEWAEEKMRDSGICEFQPAQKFHNVPKVSPLLSQTFTYTASIENINGKMTSEDETPVKSNSSPVAKTRRERKGDADSSDEQWRSVTDVSDVDSASPPRSPVCSSAGGERDEGFETESHSTVSSNVGGAGSMDMTNSPPPSSFDSQDVSLSLSEIGVNENMDLSVTAPENSMVQKGSPNRTGLGARAPPPTKRSSPLRGVRPATSTPVSTIRSAKTTNTVQKSVSSSSSTASSQRGGRSLHSGTRTTELRARRSTAIEKAQTTPSTTAGRVLRSSAATEAPSTSDGGSLMKRFVNTFSSQRKTPTSSKDAVTPRTSSKSKIVTNGKPVTPRMSRVRSAANRPPSSGSTSSSQNTSPTRSANVSRQTSSSSVITRNPSSAIPPRVSKQRISPASSAGKKAREPVNQGVPKSGPVSQSSSDRVSNNSPKAAVSNSSQTGRKIIGKSIPNESGSSDSGKKASPLIKRPPKIYESSRNSSTESRSKMLEYPSKKLTASVAPKNPSPAPKASTKTWERLKSPPQRYTTPQPGKADSKNSPKVASPLLNNTKVISRGNLTNGVTLSAQSASSSPKIPVGNTKTPKTETGGTGKKPGSANTAAGRINRIWR